MRNERRWLCNLGSGLVEHLISLFEYCCEEENLGLGEIELKLIMRAARWENVEMYDNKKYHYVVNI